MTAVRCLANPHALVGEGPVWDDRRQVLWWIDVKQPRLFRYDPGTGENRALAMPERIGCVALRANGGLIGAFKTGFKWIDPDTRCADADRRPGGAPAGQPVQRRQVRSPRPALRRHHGRRRGGVHRHALPARPGPFGARPVHGCASLQRPRLEPGRPAALLHRFAAPDALGLRLRPRDRRGRQPADLRPSAGRRRRSGRPLRRRRGLHLELSLGWCPDHPLRARGRIERVLEMPVPQPACCAFGGPDFPNSTSPRRRSG